VFRGGAHTADDDHPPLLALHQHVYTLIVPPSSNLDSAPQ
jgi:hypothetical protein